LTKTLLRERAYLSNSYINSLKEAGELVGVSVFGIQRRCLGEIGSFFGGISGKSKNDFINGNSKFITYKNVFSNLSTNLEIKDTVNINNGEQQRTLQRGDIIFTGSSEIIEECGMSSVITGQVKENLYLNSFCFFLRLNDLETLLPDFSKYLFRSKYVRKQIVKTASGVTRFNVSKVLMEKVEIIVPSIPVQEHIVSILDKFDAIVNDISKGLPKEIELRQKQYEHYREKLLSFEK
jgi:putative type I restriction enzyme (specificity subunit)